MPSRHLTYAVATVGPDGRCLEANETAVGDVYTQPPAGNSN
jgi:hypothetical protein